MDEQKRYFTSPLGFTDGTDYIEFDNGVITFVFVNGARQTAHGMTIGNLEDAVSRKVYEEYDKPPAGTVRSIIEKVELLADSNRVADSKSIPKMVAKIQSALDAILSSKTSNQNLSEIGEIFTMLIVLSKAKGTGLIPAARVGYEEIQSALSQSETLNDVIPVDFRNGRVGD